mgnify:CR=1 FL=1
MAKLKIQFTLFSAFYSPLIFTMSGGFLEEEGLNYEWSIAESGRTAIDALVEGSAEVVQTAPSQSFGPISREKKRAGLILPRLTKWMGYLSPVVPKTQIFHGTNWKGLRL